MRRGRNDAVERLVRRRSTGSVDSTRGGSSRLLPGRIREQLANQQQALAIVVDREVRHAAPLVVRHRTAELLLRDVLVRDGADDVGPGHEHVARVLHHDGEVGDRRRIDGAAGARAHDGGDLRDDARGERVAKKDVGVAGERQHAFLDARAAGIVEADDRRAHLHRQIHDLDDLRGVGLGERAAEDGEVLREGVGEPAVRRRPLPATTPSPGMTCSAMPKSRHRCVTSASISSKVPGSNRWSMRSRAVSRPDSRWPLETLLAAAERGPPLQLGQPAEHTRVSLVHAWLAQVTRPGSASHARWPAAPAPSPSPSGSARDRCRSAGA